MSKPRKPGDPRRVKVALTTQEAASILKRRKHNALFNRGLDAAIRAVEDYRAGAAGDTIIESVVSSLRVRLLAIRKTES